MSGQTPDPEDQEREVPWWESGRSPEKLTVPTNPARRFALVAAIVVVALLLGLVVWGIVTGAATMGSMPM